MPEFQLSFFGGLHLTLGDQDLTRPLSVKAQGLVCYLACDRRPQTRSKLAGMFWSDKPEADALRSLRVDLTKMRKYIAPYLDVTRQNLSFLDNGTHWLDTQTFDHHLQLAQNADGLVARTHLREATQLYTGEFLEGYLPGDALGFEEWMLVEQEGYRSRALAAMEKLLDLDIGQQEYDGAIECASKILWVDPWREEAHRSLMWLYMKNGQRAAALRQYDQCLAVLENELGVEPEPQTVQLWQQIKEQEGASVTETQPLLLPQAATKEENPFQAPPQVPFFSGRDAELDQLKTQIEEGRGVQVICVAGMGGVGKTSFAVEFAHQNKDIFADGVLWASAANNPETIAERWAVAYGYDFRGIPRIEDRLRAVRGMLAEKQALIVVDGVEVAARVKPLIPTNGKSVVLVTVRNADLADALAASLFDLNVLTVENGRSLLSHILGEDRVEREQSAAIEICRALQNLPLALAIAGQYLVGRPRRRLDDFLQRLKKSPMLDETDSAGAVRTSFNISWTALDQVQRRVFALLAVFEGRAFNAAAMAHIADRDFYEMQDHLDALVTRSLLIEQGQEYYRQHALLSHFADGKLGDKREPSLRMVDYYSKFTDEYSTDYQKLGEEWDNLDAAVQIMSDEHLWQTLFRVNQNLNQAWFAQGLFDRAQRAYRLGYEGALTLEDDRHIGENLYWQGMSVLEQGQYDKARSFFEPAFAIFEELDDVVSISDIQYDLARIHLFQARHEEAKELLERSLIVKQALNDQKGVGQIKYRQAILMNRLSKFDKALKYGNEARLIQEQTNSKLDLVRTLRELVLVYSQVEEFDLAQSIGKRAFELAQELGDLGELATIMYVLANVNRGQKQFESALELAQESLILFEKMGDIAMQAHALLQIGLVYRGTRNFDGCLVYSEKSLRLYQQISDQMGVIWALGNIGIAYKGLEKITLAKENWVLAKEMAQELNNEFYINWIDKCMEGELEHIL